MIHDLKIWPEHFNPLLGGLKTAEIRWDDRGYTAGDTLHLREFDPSSGTFTGRETTREVSHVLPLSEARGWVLLSLADPDGPRRAAFLRDLAFVLDAPINFGEVEEEALLGAAKRMAVKAGEDGRLGAVLELIREAHGSWLLGSAPRAKECTGEAARLLAALIDGRE